MVNLRYSCPTTQSDGDKTFVTQLYSSTLLPHERCKSSKAIERKKAPSLNNRFREITLYNTVITYITDKVIISNAIATTLQTPPP